MHTGLTIAVNMGERRLIEALEKNGLSAALLIRCTI